MQQGGGTEDVFQSPSAEQYQVVKALGRGSYGVVSQVRRLSDDAVFALKEIDLRADFYAALESEEDISVEAGTRAQRETEILTRLSKLSPNIVTMVEAWTSDDGESLKIVMECVDGGSLRDVLDEYTTAAWIIHRDIKPDNLLLTRDRTLLKIADLGLAKVESVKIASTRASFVGAITYCSPEELQGSSCTRRSDMYSVGCVLYEMLSGAKAFQGPIATVARSIVEGDYDQLPPHGPLDSELVALCQRLMHLKQTERPSAVELLASPCLKRHVRKHFHRFPDLRLRLAEDISAEWTPYPKWSRACRPPPTQSTVLADEWFSAYGGRIVVNGAGPVHVPELPNQDLHLKRDLQTGSWILDGKDSLGRPVTWHLDEEESHGSKACWKRGDGFLRSAAASASLLGRVLAEFSRKMVWVRRQRAAPLPGRQFFSNDPASQCELASLSCVAHVFASAAPSGESPPRRRKPTAFSAVSNDIT
ncbi:Serine/threonine-protein kinase Nek8 [Perkinsus olseni]|uniref:Serine/threonine-protein kinase Nek8 n=1 Tax=Perkinsus olseni TaxID=32597 RepID=A0A7J6NRT2_PEROL|nr:Serine/threonine-protein kinase Nek8 [Perkinsus olseni]